MEPRILCVDCGKEIFVANVNVDKDLWGHFNNVLRLGICQTCYKNSEEQYYYKVFDIQQTKE